MFRGDRLPSSAETGSPRCLAETGSFRASAETGSSRLRYGDRTEDAFRGTTESSRGDLLLTVLRHEGAHQFDRTMSSRLQKLLHTIKNECSRVEDWLRAGVAAGGVGANNFFKKAPQEIIASQSAAPGGERPIAFEMRVLSGR